MNRIVPECRESSLFEIPICGAITTSLKSVVSMVCQSQGRVACRHPATAGRVANIPKDGSSLVCDTKRISQVFRGFKSADLLEVSKV